MPELVRFEGLIIVMLYKDVKHHNKPHVHIYYGEYAASMGLDGTLLAGSLPGKQLKMAIKWVLENEFKLHKAWGLAIRGEPFDDVSF